MLLVCICNLFRHKVAHKDNGKEVELKGKMRINNGFLPSIIKHVTIVVKGTTPAKDIVGQALVKFDMEVSPNEQ